MSRRFYDLPPFTALAAFEAAARHLSFKTAAEELSVTPGAVSHQIKALEGELGVQLFLRRHRGVELTSDGEALQDTLAKSFQHIAWQLSRLRKSGVEAGVTVGATTAVAALWLSPAVIGFWREFPDIDVHQVTQDRPFQNVRDFDFFITYGQMQAPSLEHIPLFRDELVPVAAPDLAHRLRGQSLAALAVTRLIHLDAANPSWTRWADWFTELGYRGEIARGARVTSYSVALQIASEGVGLALGWRRLIQPLLSNGTLAVVGPHSLPAPHQFHLAGLPDPDLSEPARVLKSWLLTRAAQDFG